MPVRKKSNTNFVAEEPRQGWAYFEDMNQWRRTPEPWGAPNDHFPKEYGDWVAVKRPQSWQPPQSTLAGESLLSGGAGLNAAGGGAGGGTGHKLGKGGHGQQPYDLHSGEYEGEGGSSRGPVFRGKVTPPQSAHVRQEANKAVNPAGGHDPQGNPVYTYMQCSGNLYDPEGGGIAAGSSGKDIGILKGRNNPAMQSVPYVGPIPVGLWRIGAWRPDKPIMGPHVRELLPDPVTARAVAGMGRDPKTFYLHGGGINASQGCILMPPNVRLALPEGAWIRVLPCETP
jgi:hypothetical protein